MPHAVPAEGMEQAEQIADPKSHDHHDNDIEY